MDIDLEAWRKAAAKAARSADLDQLGWMSPDGLTLKPLYTAADIAGLSHAHSLPGFAPFIRGPQATMYSTHPWSIRQYGGFSTAEESNALYRKALASGAHGLSVAFDLATHRGYDSDHPRVAGDVGKAGVAVDSVEDMKILFEGIRLDRTSVSMTMSGAVLPVLACYIVAAREQSIDQTQLAGTIQNDILKEFLVRNTYIYPPEPSLHIVADIIEYTARRMPKFNSVSISGYHIQEAGATPTLELAFALADGKEYVKAALRRGMDIDDFAGRLSFFFCVGMNFYLEIAKLRAARLLWWQIMRDFGAKRPQSMMLRTHCQTSGWSLTEQAPENNIIRTTIEAMAAIFGGTQSLHTNAFDEALALPSEASARTALNTQLVLRDETHLTKVVDPWGGSYMMERLTHELAAKVTSILREIDGLGGMTKAIQSGWAKMRIEACAAEKQARIERQQDVIVGVNKYSASPGSPVSIRKIDNSSVLATQIGRLQRLRSTRDGRAVARSLEDLTRAARAGDANLLELSIRAAACRATVGEITSALESVYGRYQARNEMVAGIFSAAFEQDADWQALRRDIARFVAEQGRAPRILIAKLGQDGHDRGAKVIAMGFSDLGFDVDIGPLFQTPQEVAVQAIENDVHIIGVSTLAAGHTTLVPQLLSALSEHGATDIKVCVGGIVPAGDCELLKKVGVVEVFGPGSAITACARSVLRAIPARSC